MNGLFLYILGLQQIIFRGIIFVIKGYCYEKHFMARINRAWVY